MRRNKDDREMFFDNQAYFSTPMPGMPFSSNNMMYYNNPGMVQYPNYQTQPYYDNSLNIRVDKLERNVKKLEEKIQLLENKNNSTYQTTNNNYSSNDTYMV